MTNLIAQGFEKIESEEEKLNRLRAQFTSLRASTHGRLMHINRGIRLARHHRQNLDDQKAHRREVDQLLSAITVAIQRGDRNDERYQELLAEFQRTSQTPQVRGD